MYLHVFSRILIHGSLNSRWHPFASFRFLQIRAHQALILVSVVSFQSTARRHRSMRLIAVGSRGGGPGRCGGGPGRSSGLGDVVVVISAQSRGDAHGSGDCSCRTAFSHCQKQTIDANRCIIHGSTRKPLPK